MTNPRFAGIRTLTQLGSWLSLHALACLAAAQVLTVPNGELESPVVGPWSTILPSNWTLRVGAGVGDVGLTSTGGAKGSQQCLYGNQLAGTLTSSTSLQAFPGPGTATLTYWSKRENSGSYTVRASLVVGGAEVASRTDTIRTNAWAQLAVSYPVTSQDVGRTVQIQFAFSGSGAWQGYLDEIALALSNSLPTIGFSGSNLVQQETNPLCQISVFLSQPATNTVNVNHSYVGGTAAPGTSFSYTPGTLTFAPGVVSNSFNFAVVDNSTYGAVQSIIFGLSAAGNAAIGACSNQTVWIVDPEDHPTSAVYYVDSLGGSDANSGATPDAAWKTLAKINATTFKSGDKILLKAGSSWTGQLHPLGSGDYNAPITIDMYGSGPKPVISGGGIAGGAVYLLNQEYWSINHLEVSNFGATNIARKQGILVKNDCVGTLNGIYVRNCYIHDVNGVMVDYLDGKESGGIVFYVTSSNTNRPSKWNDIRIENNAILNVAREGILLQSLWVNKPQDPNTYWSGCGPYYPSTEVRIASNVLERIGGDGIIPWSVNGAVVEYNFVRQSNSNTVSQGHAAIWPYICENVVFQFNEVAETQTKYDGMAFDFDNSNQNCIYQYNYSHDNQGGFLNMCSAGNANGNIVRYNISQNDGCLSGSRVFLIYGSGNHNYSVYNNTVFVSKGNPMLFEDDGGGSAASTINFWNNLIVNQGSGSVSAPAGSTFDHNLFFGNGYISSDSNRLVKNPQLVDAGGGGSGLESVSGYKLRTNSPALRAGVTVANNGGLDYWQNAVSSTSAPNIGAYNGPGFPEIVSIGTNFFWRLSGTDLLLSWPPAFRGCRLLAQTNSPSQGISSSVNDWGLVPNSSRTNQMSMPISQSAGFYRLVFP